MGECDSGVRWGSLMAKCGGRVWCVNVVGECEWAVRLGIVVGECRG